MAASTAEPAILKPRWTVALTSMEYGGITPIGLPPQWPVLIDPLVTATQTVVIGSGVRRSKIIVPGRLLATLPHAHVLDGLAKS